MNLGTTLTYNMRRLTYHTKSDSNNHLTDFFTLTCSEKLDMSTIVLHKLRMDGSMTF
jgi:hypothetical protein